MQRSERAGSSDLKYFVPLARIGAAYSYFWRLMVHGYSSRLGADSAPLSWPFYEGKMTSQRVP
jgi:hypothetical protein